MVISLPLKPAVVIIVELCLSNVCVHLAVCLATQEPNLGLILSLLDLLYESCVLLSLLRRSDFDSLIQWTLQL